MMVRRKWISEELDRKIMAIQAKLQRLELQDRPHGSRKITYLDACNALARRINVE